MRTFLVTGGAGFLGATLVRKVLSQGDKVIVYDNFSFGRMENLNFEHEHLIIIQGDVLDRVKFKATIDEYHPEIVVHLAAIHFIPYCNQNPCEALRANVEGTQSLLQVCQESSIDKIFAASSAAVYPPSDQAHVEMDPVGYFDIYGISKVFMENLINASPRRDDQTFISLRFFNIYGPYETNPHLVPRIMEQFVQGDDVIELGNLTPLRDYIYVEDMAEAILALIQRIDGTIDVFNIGTGMEYSVTDIVEKLNAITGRNVQIKSVEKYRRKVEREHLLADISKITRATGWKPRFSIEEGLKKTAQFYNLIESGKSDDKEAITYRP